MLKSIVGGVAMITLMPISLTILSLNYRQESNSTHTVSRSRGCLELPDYDAKAGFPAPFLYDTTWYHGSSPVGPHPAAAGGPLALMYFNDGDSLDCNRFDMVAFWFDLACYTCISTIILCIVKGAKLSR
jgi:hypothetical protein